MAEQLGDLTRTHTCGILRPDDVGAEVVLLVQRGDRQETLRFPKPAQ